MNDALKLHLGSGNVSLPGWINIDLDAPEADMRMDLRKPLPFADASVTHVFSEHVIEHISREEALALLRECRRVLRPEGVMRVTTPDLGWLVDSYSAAVTDGWGDLWQPASPAQMMNEGMRSWGHCFVYDRPELARIFGEAGFVSVRFLHWHESDDPVLSGLESRPYNNEIIVEARLTRTGDETPPDVDYRGFRHRDIPDLLASQGQQLESLRLRLADMSARHESFKSVQEESAERARLLRTLEDEHRAQCDQIAVLTAENHSLRQTVANLTTIREELDALKGAFESLSAEATLRAERIDELAAALGRHEAYIGSIRSSILGRMMLRLFKAQRPG